MAGNRKIRKSAEKAVKKMHPAAVVFALLFLFIGAAGGYFLAREVTKNDTFALLGEKNIALESGETYVEPGVRIISFGKDISDKVVRGGDFERMGEIPADGVYQIVYSVEDFRWGDYQLVRTVTVGNTENTEGLTDGE